MIEAKGLTFSYRSGIHVLRDVTIRVEPGILHFILGPNGAGKTTLLHCLCGIFKPGSVFIDGRKASEFSHKELARICSLVPQNIDYRPALKVRDTVLYGRYAHTSLFGGYGTSDMDRCETAMHRMEIADLAESTLDMLSGGEVKRVMIARALAQGSRFMMLDEPTAHLDLVHQNLLAQVLIEEALNGCGVVIVTHDLDFAYRLGQSFTVLTKGMVAAHGDRNEVFSPERFRELFGLPAKIIKDEGNGNILLIDWKNHETKEEVT